MNDQNNVDFNNLDNYDLQNNNTPCYKTKTFIIIIILLLLILLAGGAFLYFFILRKNDNDKDNNKNNDSIPNYSFVAEYCIQEENQTIRLISSYYLNNIIELIIDGNKVNDIFTEYTFNSIGIHKVYFLFNLSGLTSTQYMFSGLTNIISINFTSLFNTENIGNMESMFSGSRNLTFVNISNFNGKNVSSINYMFMYCEFLNSVDFSNFNAPEFQLFVK